MADELDAVNAVYRDMVLEAKRRDISIVPATRFLYQAQDAIMRKAYRDYLANQSESV